MTILRIDPNSKAATASLLSRVADIPLFSGLSRRDLERLLSQAEWFALPGGWTLFREGDQAEAVHVVVTGRLGASVRRPDGSRAPIGEVVAGETVGEMAVLSDMPRSATLVALRDSELLRLPRRAFEALLDKHPGAMRHVGRLLANRLNRTAHPTPARESPRTIAFMPLTPDGRLTSLAGDLVAAIKVSGRRCILVGPQHADRPADWFHALETNHDHVVYQADDAGSSWGRQCLRQADKVLFAVSADAELPPQRPPVALRDLPPQLCDLVLLHTADTARPHGAAPWLARIPAGLHSHVREGRRADIERLARLLTGRAVGLALSGGGARAFAHIGVIRALREAGIPIDIAGGTSMGAITAAGLAQEWSDEEFRQHMKRCFVDSNPLGDFTFPLVSLMSGRKVTRRLRRQFGETGIEDLWRPFFAVSANLTTGRQHLHRHGPVWRALRASVAIPGLLPPVIEDGEVLVDGGVLNNFPVDTLVAMGRGPIIGSDASKSHCVGECGDASEPGRLARLLGKWRGGAPGIVELLMRAGTVSSDARAEKLRNETDMLFEPPVGSFDLRDWKSFDRIVDAGYRHAAGILGGDGPVQSGIRLV